MNESPGDNLYLTVCHIHITLFFQLILSLPGHGEILNRNSLISNFLQHACAIKANEELCEELLFLLFGFDPIGFNQVCYIVIVKHLFIFLFNCLNQMCRGSNVRKEYKILHKTTR